MRDNQDYISLEEQKLGEMRGKRIKVFIASGKCYTCVLKDFDDAVMVVSGEHPGDPDNVVHLDQVSTYRLAKDNE